MLIVYVAGKLADAEKINQEYIQVLLEQKYRVSYNWTEHCHSEEKNVIAEKEIEGVRNCNALIVVITDEHYEYRGTNVEMGAALGLDKAVHVVDPFENSSFSKNNFLNHKRVRKYKTLNEVLEFFKSG